jgi:hypothetical protein
MRGPSAGGIVADSDSLGRLGHVGTLTAPVAPDPRVD